MSGLLGKAGKAYGVLRRDGLRRGARRIGGHLAETVRETLFVPRGQLLIVSGAVGDSKRYRARHYAEALRNQGFDCAVTIQDNPLLPRHADRFDAFVLQRAAAKHPVRALLARAKALGKPVIYETDDLVFDPDLLTQTAAYRRMNRLERRMYSRGVGGELLDDPYVEVCTTTTAYLADRLTRRGKRVFVVPNKLSRADIAVVDRLLGERPLDPDAVTLGYFSGSAGHDDDFATVAGVLAELLREHPQLRLFVAGPLGLGRAFAGLEQRIERSPYVEREEHFRNLARVDVNLAPLVRGDPFCEAKSELKFVEAGALGVPTVAVRNQTFSSAIEDGVDGLLAGEPDEWRAQIERLIEDPEFRRSLGERARNTVLDRYTTAAGGTGEYCAWLRQLIRSGVASTRTAE